MSRASPTRVRSVIAASTGAALAGLALVATGRTLPFPPHLDPARLVTWADDVGPTTAAFTSLRALGAALLAWIVVTASAGVVARRLRSAPATRFVDRVSLPVVRRFANGVAGAALLAATFATTTPAGAQAAPAALVSASSAVVTMHDIGPTPTDPGSLTQAPAPVAPDTAALGPTVVLPPTSAPAVPSPTPVTMRALAQEAPPAAADRSRSTWVIAPGDTLWHVAEHLVTERTGRRADAAAILDELDRLVAANADRLVVPGNADLVFPGQELRLP
jgi:hypothetical protein